MARPLTPLIVTAELGGEDQAWFNRLRTEFFPPERNVLDAHLTMFHAIPGTLEGELRDRLAAITAEFARPVATVAGLMNLGGGVAYRIVSDDLDGVRSMLASNFRGMLTMQDNSGWRPHITVQNKVTNATAQQTGTLLAANFTPRPVVIEALAFHHYEGGPWRLGKRYPFRG